MPFSSTRRASVVYAAVVAGLWFGTGCAHRFPWNAAGRNPRDLQEVAAPDSGGGDLPSADQALQPDANAPLTSTPPDTFGHPGEADVQQGPVRHAAFQIVPPQQRPAGDTVRVPLRKIPGADDVELQGSKDRVNLKVRQAPLNAVLSVIAQQQGMNIVTASDVTDVVSVTLHAVSVADALDSLMAISGCTWVNRDGIIYVSKVKASSMTNPRIQGRSIRVIPLSFASANDLEKAIKALLTPAGQVFVQQSDAADKRRTQEQIVIEDIPANIARIEQYIAQVDQPPRQVLIEAHVLQVTLTDELRHGVNFSYLQKIAGKDLALSAIGFANPLASPAAFFSIKGSRIDTLVELLKNTTDAKTLASPKVMVINGQRAKIQIGERLGYLVTTTTQTSTLQNVNFLDVGVVLEVTPQITADGQVLMNVKPKVSNGQISQGLPQEQTTQVETTVMLPDGQGIIIGGLIQEFDDDRQSKIPLLGDLWLIGRAFQFRLAKKDRREIIVALVPRIVPYGAPKSVREQVEWERADTRLFHGPLLRENRPWEARLPDAVRDPRRARWDRFPRAIKNLNESHPLPLDYYFPPASRNLRVTPTRIDEPIDASDLPGDGTILFSRVPAAANQDAPPANVMVPWNPVQPPTQPGSQPATVAPPPQPLPSPPPPAPPAAGNKDASPSATPVFHPPIVLDSAAAALLPSHDGPGSGCVYQKSRSVLSELL